MKTKLLYGIATAAVVSVVFCSTPALARDNISQLKAQVAALQKRVAALEAAKTSQQAQSQPATQQQPSQQMNVWDPFQEMQQMHEAMNQMFQQTLANEPAWNQGMFSSQVVFNPKFNIKEEKHRYVVTFDMTGMDKDKVDIEVNQHMITVKGERNAQETQKGKNRYFQEQTYGSFIRSIPVPPNADTTKMSTQKKGDQLIIILPKKTA